MLSLVCTASVGGRTYKDKCNTLTPQTRGHGSRYGVFNQAEMRPWYSSKIKTTRSCHLSYGALPILLHLPLMAPNIKAATPIYRRDSRLGPRLFTVAEWCAPNLDGEADGRHVKQPLLVACLVG